MELTQTQADHFKQRGFLLIPNPFGESAMRAIDQRQVEIEPEWEQREWPEGSNPRAGRFFMIGEPLLQLVENPDIVALARHLLECDDVHVGACAIGDVTRTVEKDGQSWRQLYWHADGDPNVPQLSIRTALDRHGPGNAPLRVLPGSYLRAIPTKWRCNWIHAGRQAPGTPRGSRPRRVAGAR